MIRHVLVRVHRYVGLAMTVFLIIVGLTGSVLAFYHELDRWLNPELLAVPAPGTDARSLRVTRSRRGAGASGAGRLADLVYRAGEVYSAWAEPKTDPATGEAYALPYNELYLDPYTGNKIGTRQWGQVSLAPEHLLPFLYRLHMTLALPESTGSLGGYILGITALLWKRSIVSSGFI